MTSEIHLSLFLPTYLRRLPSLHHCLVTVILMGSLFTRGSCQDDAPSPSVIIDPLRLAVEVNTSVEIRCNFTMLPSNYHVVNTTWYNSDLIDIQSLNSTRFTLSIPDASMQDVVLNIQDSVEKDSGTYTCVVVVAEGPPGKNSPSQNVTPVSGGDSVPRDMSPGAYNGTFIYVVYVMPTYVREGLIILGVNLALAIVFGGCLIRSILADKKRLTKYGRVASSG